MTDPDYLTLTQAAQALGISRWTIYRRIAEAGLPVYQTPAKRSVKLLRRADVEALATPQRATPVAAEDAPADAQE